MAILYVDTDGSGATSPYDTWAKAAQGLEAALEDGACTAGSTIYMQGAASDSSGTSVTLTSAGTVSNPVHIIGVKDGTTNAPPIESDLVVRGTDTLPIFETTGSADIVLVGFSRVYGLRFVSGDNFTLSGAAWVFEDCELKVADILLIPTERYVSFINCEKISTDAGGYFTLNGGARMNIIGGLFSGPSSTRMISGTFDARITLRGVDVSSQSNILDEIDIRGAGNLELSNCKMKASWALVEGQGATKAYQLKAIGCSDTTGKGSGESFQDFIEETYEGTTELETTAVRTGGADDGADGAWGWKLTPNVDSTRESVMSLASPWMEGWVAGDGSTSFTFTVYVANSGAADYNEDDVSLEILTPTATSGTAQHDHDQGDHATNIIPGSSTAVTDDTDSTWGTGGNNPQKMSVSVTPDFEGPFYARVHFWKTFAASPETLYVDPLVAVT